MPKTMSSPSIHDIDFAPLAAQNMSLQESFRIVSWNTLANKYTHSHKTARPFVNQKVFNQRHRHNLLAKTFQKFVDIKIDFVCLQEVDFKEARQILVDKNSYTRLLTPTGNGDGDRRVDACCIFYKSATWDLVGTAEIVNLDDLVEEDYLKCRSRKLRNTFRRGNFGIIARFRHKYIANKIVMICNTHLYWNANFEYVKLRQAHYLCSKAKSLLERAQDRGEEESHFVFCGDLNSLPGGLVHAYLSMGKVYSLGYPSFTEEYLECPLSDLGLKSIHAKYNEDGSVVAGEEGIEYTNATADFRGVIDYIFHAQSLCLTNVISFPALEGKRPILPTVKWASDHLAIGAEFSFTKTCP